MGELRPTQPAVAGARAQQLGQRAPQVGKLQVADEHERCDVAADVLLIIQRAALLEQQLRDGGVKLERQHAHGLRHGCCCALVGASSCRCMPARRPPAK
jgi:hypothetical protein